MVPTLPSCGCTPPCRHDTRVFAKARVLFGFNVLQAVAEVQRVDWVINHWLVMVGWIFWVTIGWCWLVSDHHGWLIMFGNDRQPWLFLRKRLAMIGNGQFTYIWAFLKS